MDIQQQHQHLMSTSTFKAQGGMPVYRVVHTDRGLLHSLSHV